MLQQPSFPSSAQQQQGPAADVAALPFALDPNTAKQMAALQATSLAKVANRSAPGGVTSASYFGGLSAHQLSRPDSTTTTQETTTSFLTALPNIQPHASAANPPNMNVNLAAMQQQQQQQQLLQQQQQQHQQQTPAQRKRNFLSGLANLMLNRNTPLPPQLTGVPTPSYDPSGSPWRNLEVSNTEHGVVRLAGKDIDLFRLWAVVQAAGGVQKLTQSGQWNQVLNHFELPDHFIQPATGQQQPTVLALSQYYNVLLGPFEEVYKKSRGDRAMVAARNQAAQAAQMAGAAGRPGGMGGMSGTFPPVGSLPAITGQSGLGMTGQSVGGGPAQPTDASFGGINGVPFSGPQGPSMQQHQMPNNVNGIQEVPDMARINGVASTPSQGSDLHGPAGEPDAESRKRKLEETEDGKRVKHKSGDSSELRGSMPPSNHAPNMNAPSRPVRQPSRRKIEYIPFARDLETAGGRDLDAIQHELQLAAQRPIRDLTDWGAVDVEALTLSLRSRLSTELSYALTTYTILSNLRGPFIIMQAPDLYEELLDLIEDVAFGGPEEDAFNPELDATFVTHRHLLSCVMEEENQTFASLKSKQGQKDPGTLPHQRPGDLISCAMNIIRNLSCWPENVEFLAKHGRTLNILLRICTLQSPANLAAPQPLSPALSLPDLLRLRKDLLLILFNIALSVHFSSRTPHPPGLLRDVRRAFNILAGFVADPTEAVPPMQSVRQFNHGNVLKAPQLVENALEVFNRLSHPDENRLVFAQAVPQESLWAMIEAVVHRLPVTDNDFTIVVRGEWQAFMERAALSLYSLGFLAPPKLKKRVKTDRHLAFRSILLRIVRKLMMSSPPEHRAHWIVIVRRMVEAMKVIDDAGDSFDSSSSSSGPILAFGMGYGEHGETREEKGMGLLSGHQDEVTWGLMMQREILSDEVVFSELTSLARIQPLAS